MSLQGKVVMYLITNYLDDLVKLATKGVKTLYSKLKSKNKKEE